MNRSAIGAIEKVNSGIFLFRLAYISRQTTPSTYHTRAIINPGTLNRAVESPREFLHIRTV